MDEGKVVENGLSYNVYVRYKAIDKDLEKLQKGLMRNKLSLKFSQCLFRQNRNTVLRSLQLKVSLKTRDHKMEVSWLQTGNSLHWKYHASVLSSKVSKAVGFSKHAKSILPLELLRPP